MRWVVVWWLGMDQDVEVVGPFRSRPLAEKMANKIERHADGTVAAVRAVMPSWAAHVDWIKETVR